MKCKLISFSSQLNGWSLEWSISIYISYIYKLHKEKLFVRFSIFLSISRVWSWWDEPHSILLYSFSFLIFFDGNNICIYENYHNGLWTTDHHQSIEEQEEKKDWIFYFREPLNGIRNALSHKTDEWETVKSGVRLRMKRHYGRLTMKLKDMERDKEERI